MRVQLIGYPTCSTCKKALKYLKDHEIDTAFRHIVEQTPDQTELHRIWKKSGLPLRKLFNTSGNAYKELQLKDKLDGMSEEEQLMLLASNGMLIKRPILISDTNVLIGFDEKNYQKVCDDHKNVV